MSYSAAESQYVFYDSLSDIAVILTIHV